MTRVAAVDCGTNSIRLLVADVDGGRLVDVHREMRIVRLGQGVDRTGRLAPEALARTFDALRAYAAVVARHGAERVRMVATSATRDAANAARFVDGCTAILGVAPEVVSGVEEARLSFAGATAELAGHPAPYAVCDIGGGSTEVVVGTDDVEQSVSVDVGCVRLTERRLRTDPPTAAEVVAAVADIAAALDLVEARVDVRRARTFVGLAGSVTTVAALALGLDAYDPARIHLARVAAADVERVSATLLRATRAERAAYGVMHPGRADVIAAGALVLREVVRRWDVAEVVASERDILDGIAYAAVTAPGTPDPART
ncbi:MAG: exopolyphosphatase / guanosine-5-triphosphate,3-diphosphate pyrophosphatase [Frankiaceae bacterium]|nr:exopolyphosphatase / guanosine-5-triphosphate,3-diphosphate pyrophosphatase [Frankiaceae bacterium]